MSSPEAQKADCAGVTDDKPAVVVVDDISKTSNLITLDEATNKRLLRKIDWKLMPVVSGLATLKIPPLTDLISVVLYICAPILRQGHHESGSHLWTQDRSRPPRWPQVPLGHSHLLYWLHCRHVPHFSSCPKVSSENCVYSHLCSVGHRYPLHSCLYVIWRPFGKSICAGPY